MNVAILKEQEVVESSSRRDFLSSVTGVLAGLMGLAIAIPAIRYLIPAVAEKQNSAWIDAGDIEPTDGTSPRQISFRRTRQDGWKVLSESETAWLSANPQGQLQVFSPRCTHLGCAYGWDRNAGQFVCPCHGSRFDKNGNVLAGPAKRPLDRYPAKLVGKRLWLAIGQQKNA